MAAVLGGNTGGASTSAAVIQPNKKLADEKTALMTKPSEEAAKGVRLRPAPPGPWLVPRQAAAPARARAHHRCGPSGSLVL